MHDLRKTVSLAVMARKAQDPLGDVRALMTGNTIAFKAGENEDDTTFGFQLQPVYSLSTQGNLNMIARAVIPIIGAEAGVVVPPIGGEPRPEGDSMWGLSDTIAQFFFSPKSDSSLKWGLGPQVSLKTHTSDRTAGPGWGGGVAEVIFGGAGQWAFGSGDGLDLSIGAYPLVERPDNAAKWQLKFGISYFFN